MFKCEQCPSTFQRKGNLTAHQKNHDGVRFTCTVCASTFGYKSHLNRHMKNKHAIARRQRGEIVVPSNNTRNSNNMLTEYYNYGYDELSAVVPENDQSSVPAHRQPVTRIVAQPGRQCVVPSPTPQGHIQIAPQIFVPDVAAGGSNTAFKNSPPDNDIRIPVIDETQDLDDNITVDDLQKKWKNVKDYYKKEKKELASGSAATKKKKNVYFEMLGFLDTTIERRSTTSNVIDNKSIIENLQDVQHNIDKETIESDPLENEVLPKSKTIIQPRKQKMTDFQKSVVEVLSKRKINNDNEDFDEDKLFLLSLLPTLKKMPSDKKFDFKIQIMQMLKNINSQANCNLPLTNNVMNQYPYPVQTNVSNYYSQSTFQNQMPIPHQTPYISNTVPNIYQNITPNSSSHNYSNLFSPCPPNASNQSAGYIDVDYFKKEL
eukprot:XP_016664388.1 PREDICTED: uncharacterized protein LOC107885292 [Acyrthosiphon pisum]